MSAGTGTLVRLALRRDRLLLPVWIVLVAGVVVATASAIAELYPSLPGRRELGVMISANPALRALTGPVLDPESVGGLTAWRVTTIASVLTALMSVFLVTRHTRAEEESGRAELLGAGPTGRHAPATAALLVAALANTGIGALVALGLAGQGLAVPGSLALGAAIALTGWLFATLTLAIAQLTEYARAANAGAGALLGLSFLVRAAGDATDAEALSWASPLGWAPRVRPFAGERWWVLALMAAVSVIAVLATVLLVRNRDLGSGMLARRAGRATAAPYLRGPLGLAWRQQRGALLGWTAGFVVAGALFGTLAESVADMVAANRQIADLIARMGGGDAQVDAFIATAMGMLALVAGGYAVQAASRPHGEEAATRAEPVLAAAVPRRRWLAGHLVWALTGSALLMAVAGLAAGLAHGWRAGEPLAQAARVLAAALVQVPAVWVLVGLAAFLFGVLPRLVALAWAALVAFVLLGQLGQLLRIDQRVRDLSPFAHLPQVPGDDITPAPFLWLLGVTAALLLAGTVAFQRRDLRTE
ncbi:ABC transporter permease [Nonomuraea sp. NPDC048826]|uniref:ABC transporter permease n=1 Tax=Nonomuraea sp. NPDC048826 TaxID=3364347 RepID=UPI003712784A